MLIDLHMHERTCSSDSFLALEDMVDTARRLGLDAICITDHDSMGLRDTAAAYSARTGFPIFVGVEYYSLQGDIVAFGIDEVPAERIPAQEFIDEVHRQGGVCIAAHPFRSNRRGLEDALFQVTGLDGVEAFNGSTDYAANLRALAHCRDTGIQPVGASDCHVAEKIGVYATWFPDWVHNVEELIACMRKGECHPVGYIGGQYIDMRAVADHLVPDTCVLPRQVISETGSENSRS